MVCLTNLSKFQAYIHINIYAYMKMLKKQLLFKISSLTYTLLLLYEFNSKHGVFFTKQKKTVFQNLAIL